MRKLKLFERRMCWLPTWQGWLMFAAAMVLLVVIVIGSAMPFLAVTQPVRGTFLVVEGWAPDYALDAAVQVFHSGGYQKLVVTGTSIEEGKHITVAKTYAELAGSTLRQSGFKEEYLVVLPSPNVQRDRTYTTALTVNEWLRTNHFTNALDIFTMGPHARRTRLLYEKAIRGQNRIGVISFPSHDYDPSRWWLTSQGFRETVDEWIAYLYARFLFAGK